MTDALPDDKLPEELPEDAALELGIDIDEFADEVAEQQPPEETTAPAPGEVGFYDAGPDGRVLDHLNFSDRVGVLERLGPAHFRSKGFSFMGFLQTVYDHVAAETRGDKPAEEDAPEVQ